MVASNNAMSAVGSMSLFKLVISALSHSFKAVVGKLAPN